jgi:hypothetical protein
MVTSLFGLAVAGQLAWCISVAFAILHQTGL